MAIEAAAVKQITSGRRLQLIGLFTLAEQNRDEAKQIERGIQQLIGTDDFTKDAITDHIWGTIGQTVDQFLAKLGIEVVDAPRGKPGARLYGED